MNHLMSMCFGVILVGQMELAVLAPADVWLSTRARIALLTTDGLSVSGLNIDSVNGEVTLHGRVRTEAERGKAALALQGVDGVKSVRNLLQVAPNAFRAGPKVSDDAIKVAVEAALKSDRMVDGVRVSAVNNGVVLLSGKAARLEDKLRAVELAWSVAGVSRVASDIETRR